MATELWHADIEVTETLVKNCIQDQFPELAPVTLKLLGEGWDNKVFLVDEKIIFRFPRRKIAIEAMHQENRLLKSLESQLEIDIPTLKYIGQPTDRYPYTFHGYEMLKGISGCHAQLTDQQRIGSLPVISRFLKQLHSINAEKAQKMGVTTQSFDRTNLDENIKTLDERIEKIIERKIQNINKNVLQNEYTIARKIQLPEDKCLIHGDLYSRHLLFQNGKLTGIIDWGDASINNRSVDLSVIWGFYPSDCHKQFFEIYGPVDSDTWQSARFIALYIAFIIMLYGSDIGDTLLVEEAINSIKRLNKDLLIKGL